MDTKKNRNMNKGAAFLAIFFMLLFLLLFVRFFYIEVTKEVSGKALDVLASRQWTEKQTIEAKRGSILDRHGEVLAQDIPSYTLYAIVDKSYPNHVKDAGETAEKLSAVLGATKQELVYLLTQEDRFQVEFGSYGKQLTLEQKKEIENMQLPGLNFVRESRRYYPNQVFASHVIGFSSTDEERGRQDGKMGLEKSLNDYLIEQEGTVSFKTDRNGDKLPIPDETMTKPKNGNDVYLTIDEKIQLFVEQALDEVVDKYQPQRAIAVVANPKTGEVLAMGNRPSFNPNDRNVENYTNFAISSRFEPGSTMKVFTLAAAIEEGVYNGQETYQSGSYKAAGGIIHDHNDGDGWGQISFDEGVRRSSNVGFAILAKEKIGLNRLYQYLVKFGFDKPTGIDLPNEANSKFVYEYELEKVTTAFGQGTAVTPIQQIQAATAIANDGVMMRPYVVKEIVDPTSNKKILENKPKTAGKPISAETASKVRDLLETVVTDGTGKPFAIEGYQIVGKTGTAQIPSPEGGYLTGWGNYIYSFLGMAPKDAPELLVYVAVDRPELENYEVGSTPTSELFTSIMKNSLQYLNIQPSKAQDEKDNGNATERVDSGITLRDYTGMTLAKAGNELEEQGFQVVVLGKKDSKVSAQVPYAGANVLIGERVVLKGEGEATMPDLTGWSLADVLKIVEILQLKSTIDGKGFVTTQNIQANEKVREGDHLSVELSPPKAMERHSEMEKETIEINE